VRRVRWNLRRKEIAGKRRRRSMAGRRVAFAPTASPHPVEVLPRALRKERLGPITWLTRFVTSAPLGLGPSRPPWPSPRHRRTLRGSRGGGGLVTCQRNYCAMLRSPSGLYRLPTPSSPPTSPPSIVHPLTSALINSLFKLLKQSTGLDPHFLSRRLHFYP
jgi:hypothetical protein